MKSRQERIDFFAAHALGGLLAAAGNAHQDVLVSEAATLAEELVEELDRRDAPPVPAATRKPGAKKPRKR